MVEPRVKTVVKCEWCQRVILNPRWDKKNCSKSHRNLSRELRNARASEPKSITSRFYTLKRRIVRGELCKEKK